MNSNPEHNIHVVVGAGEVGSSLASQLAESGEHVVVVTRSGTGPDHSNIKKVSVDAANYEVLVATVPRAAVVYNAVNPPYDKWPTDWPPIANSLLRYAESTGAVLVTCSNLYGYGPGNETMTETLPLAATGTKGKVRAQMWHDARKLSETGRIRATEVRASDFICKGMGSRFGDRVVPSVLTGKEVQMLGKLDALHSWSYPPDVARLMIVVGKDERAWGKAWHVPSNPPRTQRQVMEDITHAVEGSKVQIRAISSALVFLLGMFNALIRELRETAYQFDRTFIMDDSAARKAFDFEPTPWNDVIKDLVAAYK
jgi:nucleoside-diphosphate-sugar epimerase